MTSGRRLMDKARETKAKKGTQAAAKLMESNGISYELSMIALIGLMNYRNLYNSPIKSCREK